MVRSRRAVSPSSERARRGGRPPRSGARAGRTGRAAGRPRRRPRRRARAPRSSRLRRPGAARPSRSPRRRRPGPLFASARGRRAPARRRPRGGRDPQHRPCGAAGGVVEQLAQLGEAELDEPVQPLADLRLLGHEGHREAGSLAQLEPASGSRVGRLLTHAHLGEAPGIGRIGLRPAQATLGKVLRRERVDHRHRHAPPREVARERDPVVARRLHRHQRHRLGLPLEPGVERVEARPALATRSTSDRPWPRPSRQRAATCARPPMSIPTLAIPSLLPTRRVPARSARRQLMARSPVNAVGSRSPFEAGGRGPDSSSNGHLPDRLRRSPRGGRSHHRPHKELYQAAGALVRTMACVGSCMRGAHRRAYARTRRGDSTYGLSGPRGW